MSWITAPFAWLLKALYELTGSYGWAVILFGVVVNLILLPFMAKSKKSMMRTSRLQPRIAELQRRHEGNQQKLNEEMAKLYREEKINPMSGCLWSLIPFPILIALYSVIRQPLTKMMGLSAEAVTQLTDWVTTNAGYVAQTKSAYQEIQIADLIHQNWDAVTGALGDFSGKLLDIDYSFIGLNMGQQPSFKIWTFDWSNKAVWLPALGLFLIPIVSAVLSWLSMKISTSMTPQPAANQQQAATTNKTMMIMMPLVSLWICYTMPAALGIYWIVNSILGILRDVSLTKVFNKQLDKLDAERIAREKERDAELERKRLETERLKAAGETVVNPNTSKKKIQASQKQKDDERKAAAMREERAARRERLGVEQAAAPESQVGNRRYARGRAYARDHYAEGQAAASEAEQTPAAEAPEGKQESTE
jgi:YidC/Oxa1 family membrane protein insertase